VFTSTASAFIPSPKWLAMLEKMARVNFEGTLSKIFKKLLMLSYFVNPPQIVS
jgi:hypothetical protein